MMDWWILFQAPGQDSPWSWMWNSMNTWEDHRMMLVSRWEKRFSCSDKLRIMKIHNSDSFNLKFWSLSHLNSKKDRRVNKVKKVAFKKCFFHPKTNPEPIVFDSVCLQVLIKTHCCSFQIYLHHQGEDAQMKDKGFAVAPGSHTLVAVKRVEVHNKHRKCNKCYFVFPAIILNLFNTHFLEVCSTPLLVYFNNTKMNRM